MSSAATQGADLSQEDLTTLLGLFWHPVCTLDELDATTGGVLGVRLLGQDLAIARLAPDRVSAMVDRCPHRSTRLSVGRVDRGAVRCAYHGWRWDGAGRCVEIPSAPLTPIPARFCQRAFSAEVDYGLVWVRLDDRAGTCIPAMPATADPTMRVVPGAPYTWPTSAPRRVENFVDLAHFAWVHDGTLGRREEAVPPAPDLARIDGELRFRVEPPAPDAPPDAALVGGSDYRMPMPLTVDIAFDIAGRPGVRRHLWMTASPMDPGTCRTFWMVARSDAHDEPDAPYLAFQDVVLAEDEPVVCNQVPAALPLEPAGELHVKADRVSVEYRRWLLELTAAVAADPHGAGPAVTAGLERGGHRPLVGSEGRVS